MNFIAENWSSPGAHFSDNTNSIIKKIDNWIKVNNYPALPFIEFRKRLSSEIKINDNNARNVYPLLKNSGLISYAPGEILHTKYFFTDAGKAYVKVLLLIDEIENNKTLPDAKKKEALYKLRHIVEKLIFDCLEKLVHNKTLNYRLSLVNYILYLLEFKKIDKNEFAYMVYMIKQYPVNWKDEMRQTIEDYRKSKIRLEAKVKVRNDKKIQEETGQLTRLEGISFLTSYSFLSALVEQAGITTKDNGYHYLRDDMKNITIEKLVE